MSLVGFPLLLIPLAIINIVVFLMPDLSLGAPLLTVPLISGAGWTVSFSDILLALGLVLVLFEVMKASRPHGRYLTDHFLSLLVLVGALAEFLLLPRFATSVFFLLIVMMAMDLVVGLSLGLRRRRTPPDARRAAAPAETVPVGPVPPVAPMPVREEPAVARPQMAVPEAAHDATPGSGAGSGVAGADDPVR
jgi:hypothetical protein